MNNSLKSNKVYITLYDIDDYLLKSLIRKNLKKDNKAFISKGDVQAFCQTYINKYDTTILGHFDAKTLQFNINKFYQETLDLI